MPWEAREGHKIITIELREDVLDSIDAYAKYLGMSRAAYIRQAMVRDMERQGPAPAAKA
jgi:metal-responsive CopG/Arc/MetJ family transcriptional regulator